MPQRHEGRLVCRGRFGFVWGRFGIDLGPTWLSLGFPSLPHAHTTHRRGTGASLSFPLFEALWRTGNPHRPLHNRAHAPARGGGLPLQRRPPRPSPPRRGFAAKKSTHLPQSSPKSPVCFEFVLASLDLTVGRCCPISPLFHVCPKMSLVVPSCPYCSQSGLSFPRCPRVFPNVP